MLFLTMVCAVVCVASAQRMKAVDLGLSVKWANMNVGADSPEDYGDYFAWGEVRSKRYYGEYSTYKHFDYKRLHKYNYLELDNSVVDRLLSLEASDDAASVRLGKGWRMPTEAEVSELLEKCDFRVANHNGTRGFWIKNRNVQNDSIFLPMVGCRDFGSYRYFPGTQCYYWTSTLLVPDSLKSTISKVYAEHKKDSKITKIVRAARCMQYSENGGLQILFVDRRIGCAIRPVIDRNPK